VSGGWPVSPVMWSECETLHTKKGGASRLPIVSPKGVDSRTRHRTREHERQTVKASRINMLDQQCPSMLR
jgi:hypothetical protein